MAPMIDVALLRDEPEVLKASLQRRALDIDVDALVEMDGRRRAVRTRAESLRAEQRQSGKKIAKLQGDEKQAAIAVVAQVSEDYKAALAEADELDARFDRIWMTIPNPVHESVPFGHSDEDNIEVKTWGDIPDFGFEPKDHMDLGQALGIIDVERDADRVALRIDGDVHDHGNRVRGRREYESGHDDSGEHEQSQCILPRTAPVPASRRPEVRSR